MLSMKTILASSLAAATLALSPITASAVPAGLADAQPGAETVQVKSKHHHHHHRHGHLRFGIYGGGCLVWDAKAHLPWEIPFYQYDTHRAIPGPLMKTDRLIDLLAYSLQRSIGGAATAAS